MYVNQWIQGHARLRPQQPAIIDRMSGRTITYSDLNHRIAQRAAYLKTLGIEKGDRLAVLSTNRVEMLETLFACAGLGAIMVPLNFRLTTAELQKIVQDAAPKALLHDPLLQHQDLEITTHPLVKLDDSADVLSTTENEADENDPVLILYTGGTTGVPKGAILTHKTMQFNAWNTIAGWRLSPDDIAPVFTPFFHTGGLNVLATPLLALGGTIVLPESASFDAELALNVIQEERCSIVFLVPTMFQMVRDAAGFDAKKLQTVKAFISGGAPCPTALFESYWSQGLPLRQGYGLTEAGPNTFGMEQEVALRRPGTVGIPLPHVRVKLLKADQTEAAPGEVGEVVIAGQHVMPGYWQRPEETTKALKDGWLHTGDLARKDEDGYYYICGRSKEMFISGGENVFPAEIEEVLASHPQVAEVAVVGVPDPHWGEVGRAFIVARGDQALDRQQLIAFCEGRLARYKTPKHVHIIDALPRSAAGKVLKQALIAVEA